MSRSSIEENRRKGITVNIDLSPDAARFVESLVEAGEYASVDEAVAAGVMLLKDRRQLKEDIQAGIDDLNAGRWTEGTKVFEELRERSRQAMQREG